MSSRVVVCSGCCCGRIEKGHSEVPVDALKNAWEKNNLKNSIELTISGCLGPCKMHNVAILMTDNNQTWLGELRVDAHFEALVTWACDVSKNGPEIKIPEILLTHQFDHKPLESHKIIQSPHFE